MSFMQPQITNEQKWIEIDGACGITFVPGDVDIKLVEMILDPNSDELEDDIKERAAQYYEGRRIDTVGIRCGFGARLSAPGYMDCTDWIVCDTEDEAQGELDNMYGDDEEEDN